MATIKLTVDSNKIATYQFIDGERLVCGNQNKDTLELDLHSDWIAPLKCRFVWGNGYLDVDVTSLTSSIFIPYLSDTNVLKIGVYKGDGEDETKMSSTYASIPVVDSIRKQGRYAQPASDENYTNLAYGYMKRAEEVVECFDNHVNEKQEEVIAAISQGTEEKINLVNAAALKVEENISKANTNLSNLSDGITQAQSTFNTLNTDLTQAEEKFDTLIENMNTLLDEIIKKQNEWIGGQA